MGDVLDRLTYLLEHENKIRNDVKSALRYPKIVLITLAGAFFFLLNWVVPSFAKLFVNAKIELPWPTRMALAMNTALSDHWYLLLAAAVGMFFGVRWWIRTSRAATCGPGRCSPSHSSARSSRCRSWPALPPSFPSSSVAASVSSIHWIFFQRPSTMPRWSGNSPPSRKTRSGQGIAEPLSTARYFTPLTINMVAVGEGAGNLETMLEDLAAHYDEEVEYAVGEMTEAIGPILIVVLAAVVGFFCPRHLHAHVGHDQAGIRRALRPDKETKGRPFHRTGPSSFQRLFSLWSPFFFFLWLGFHYAVAPARFCRRTGDGNLRMGASHSTDLH